MKKSTKKKDKIGNTILSLAQGVNKRNNHYIFIILKFLLIFNIKTIINKNIYIEKVITNFIVNVMKMKINFHLLLNIDLIEFFYRIFLMS
ncbi:hypothetical protein BK704_13905 [[Bacillus thuringiensis] serovar konkukian]|nr:hypothetical protein A9498_29900 [Bacillus thuringiensis serovar coreanensis]OUB07430.1 hypothetical protein BK704_13905 [[Bacillus thuringiensis] serovar konkukian]